MISSQSLVEQLRWRYACKVFDPGKKISDKDWAALEESLVLTPSSYGLQPWKFLIIQDSSLRKQLTSASWNQKQVETCSHFVVFGGLKKLTEKDVDRFLAKTSSVRNVPVEGMAAYRKMMVGDLISGPRSQNITDWAARQVYIALGNLMTCAALMGLDTCPMEGIEPAKYDEILGLKNDYHTVVACAVGYRSQEDKYQTMKKVRFDRKEILEVR